MAIQDLIGNVIDALTGGHGQRQQDENVLPASQDPYGDPADQGGGFGNVMPASQDPYGDPADQGFGNQQAGYGNVLPASQDPYGDPADQGGGFGNVMPASQDPYGDPADEEEAPATRGGWPF